MTTAAIYCRVSTENQEREGTSLESQRDAFGNEEFTGHRRFTLPLKEGENAR
jgi:DNA invertase Pin-like site-specific DNA recombinase